MRSAEEECRGGVQRRSAEEECRGGVQRRSAEEECLDHRLRDRVLPGIADVFIEEAEGVVVLEMFGLPPEGHVLVLDAGGAAAIGKVLGLLLSRLCWLEYAGRSGGGRETGRACSVAVGITCGCSARGGFHGSK